MIARLGLGGVEGHAESMGFLAPALNVIEPEQNPSHLGGSRLQPQRLLPGRLGPIVPPQGRVRLPLVEQDHRPSTAAAGLDSGEVVECYPRLLVVPGKRHLGHQHVGVEAHGVVPQVIANPPLRLIEPPGHKERLQPIEAREPA